METVSLALDSASPLGGSGKGVRPHSRRPADASGGHFLSFRPMPRHALAGIPPARLLFSAWRSERYFLAVSGCCTARCSAVCDDWPMRCFLGGRPRPAVHGSTGSGLPNQIRCAFVHRRQNTVNALPGHAVSPDTCQGLHRPPQGQIAPCGGRRHRPTPGPVHTCCTVAGPPRECGSADSAFRFPPSCGAGRGDCRAA